MNWCILRTAPSRTLSLAAALTEAGFTAWTPQEVMVRQIPRSKAKKRVLRPMMPMIVFVDYERVPELVAVSRSPVPSYNCWDEDLRCEVTKTIPPFSVYRHLDCYARVADRELDPLRVAEQLERPRAEARKFAPGEAVRYAGAGFDGLVGTVQTVKGRYACVHFGGTLVTRVPSSVLLPVSNAICGKA